MEAKENKKGDEEATFYMYVTIVTFIICPFILIVLEMDRCTGYHGLTGDHYSGYGNNFREGNIANMILGLIFIIIVFIVGGAIMMHIMREKDKEEEEDQEQENKETWGMLDKSEHQEIDESEIYGPNYSPYDDSDEIGFLK
jgi:preprotein translocase subunit SecG